MSSVGRFFRRFFLTRLIVYFIILTLVYGGVQIFAYQLPAQHKIDFGSFTPNLPFAAAAAIFVLGMLAYMTLRAWFERGPAKDISLLAGIPLGISGTAFGAALFATVFAILCVLSVAHYNGYRGLDGIMVPLFMSLGAGIGEELIFRGGVFRILEEGFGSFIALALSSAFFGFVHAGNPGATVVSSVAVGLEAGLLLGAAYMAARNLWLPIGVHFGWNFTEGGIFGAAVSGGNEGGALATSYSGDILLTGGKFGPEASLVAVGVCLFGAAIFFLIAARRGEWKPVSFKLLLD